MLRLRRNLTRSISFAILLSTAFADVVVLKNGEKVEGKIIKETDQQVTLEIKVSASITDERVIPAAEIERIDKASPEEESFKAISRIQLGANSLSSAQYDPVIRTFEAYVKQYPLGAHTAAVKATLAEFVAERKRVDGGEVKLRGVWLSKAEVEREKTQIGGSLALEQMKNQSAAGDHIGALNTFVAVEKLYAGASAMPEMIELARQLATAVKPAVERALPDQKILQQRKEQGFKDAGPEERPGMIAAYKSEMAQAEAAVVAAEAAGQWPPLIATNEKCLKMLLARADKEITRLNALPVEKMRQSIQLTNSAKQARDTGNWDTAATTLKEATTLWPANELAKRLTTEVGAAQKAAAAAAKDSGTAPAPETPKPKKGPATPKPSSTPAKKSAATTTRPQEEPKPFYMTLPGAIGIVVSIAAVLAGVNVYKKMKARKADPDAS